MWARVFASAIAIVVNNQSGMETPFRVAGAGMSYFPGSPPSVPHCLARTGVCHMRP